MVTVVNIQDLSAPELQVFRTLRQPTEHFRQGIFVAEGEKVVRRLLESPLPVASILLTPSWLDVLRSALEARRQPVTAYVAPKTLLETIVGFHLHQGIMAVGRVPEPATIESVLESSPHPFLFVALDGLTNAENLGVLMRSSAAFGTHAIIVGETSSSPYLRRAVRNSMGTVFTMPVVHSADLVSTLRGLQQRGITVIAAHPHMDRAILPALDLTGDCCIVFGSEGEGISERVRSACDVQAAVPMQRNVDSLNVASAAAVFLYEVDRQRRR
jgi:tRNA G18 (ribose-2'-O)-methylase SpoU